MGTIGLIMGHVSICIPFQHQKLAEIAIFMPSAVADTSHGLTRMTPLNDLEHPITQSYSFLSLVGTQHTHMDKIHTALYRIYYAKVLLGSPPKEFLVQIDTGSDGLWNYYDESVSSTSYLISCSDKLCSRAANTCTSDRQSLCSYTLHNSSGTTVAGYYVSDVLHLNITGTSEAPPSVLFGCSTSVGQPQGGFDADGVFGFGRHSFSVINQLDTLGVAAHVFSHCLDSVTGGGVLTIGYPQEPKIVYTPLVRDVVTGGGVLTIGYPQEPKIVYTPLVRDVIKYEINLESISVNRQTLPINQSLLRQGRTRVDMGEASAYLARGAFLHLLDAITKLAPDYAQPTIIDGIQCYLSDGSILARFPRVHLNFAGNASLHLRQEDYLVQQQSQGDLEVWCLGFRESTNQDTILGELFLRDKLIVYDLEGQRIGWTDSSDCRSLMGFVEDLGSFVRPIYTFSTVEEFSRWSIRRGNNTGVVVGSVIGGCVLLALLVVAGLLRGTKRGPQIVLSDLEQGRSYGPLLTRGAETKRARLIEVQTQGVCSAYSLRGTKRRPEIVHSDMEQRCSYGPLLTRATETERARSIDTETQVCVNGKLGRQWAASRKVA
ncbi:aspartic proteinase-like protein 2 [Artemisia annua]|uniref:Aspartic proteinase-like protein 2 n=1 Tax=Artemisia annua TaxID=35608 RepID=A0A2U1QN62_ARTAN|nr:aspartic proteinase-like protein 2 [Artemisia annua]